MTTNSLPVSGAAPIPADVPGSTTARRFLGSLPRAAWVLALVVAVVHIAPFWRAQLSQRDGWTFTDNLTISPDHMQYRVWTRQSQREGPIVTNRFTTEPNRAHLPIFFFWGIGKAASALGTSPERVYAYAGSVLAALLALLTFATVRHFLPDARQTWWVVVPLFVAGGLGGHFKILAQVPGIGQSDSFTRLVAIPLEAYPPFEDYRSHFIVKALLDTHSIMLWIVGLGAVMALWFAMERTSLRRIVLAAMMFALMTVMHVYEGITLLAIAGGVVLCCWPLSGNRRGLAVLLSACTLSVVICYVALGALFSRSGLPLPEWRAINILVTTLLMAYPVAWALMGWGGLALWRRAGLRERFLFGWALGCTMVTLSGPFFPYPDRGTLTMQVPLFIIAAMIFFARWRTVSLRQAAVLVAVCGATPLWLAARTWHFSGFRTDAPFQYVNASHRAAQAALNARADTSHILLADTPDLLWLAPTFPGRLYVGHFFLTVGFSAKVGALRAGLDDPALMPPLLATSGAHFVFVNARHGPERFATVPGLTPIARESVGWLFRAGDRR
ncbi:MAG: hypothetical protein ACT4P7_01365 [Gemmatimonadaceae bacterium]